MRKAVQACYFRLCIVAVGVPAAAAVGNATAVEGNCWNPMFALHWAGKSDVRHMEAQPTLQQGLNLCPFYNGKYACCPRAFEDELMVAFDRWVKHLQSKVDAVKAFQLNVVRVKDSKLYVDAPPDERALLERLLTSFAPVLEAFGNCFDTMLEYIAGMLCFSCDASWRDDVLLTADGTRVTHLRINDASNDELWQQCRSLGIAAMDMHARAYDSVMAKSIMIPFEDMTMYENKITVSEYMEREALLIMRGPNELSITVEPQDDTGRRLSPGEVGYSEINPVADGRRSGFQCSVFPRRPDALSSRCRRRSVGSVTAMIMWIIVAMRRFV